MLHASARANGRTSSPISSAAPPTSIQAADQIGRRVGEGNAVAFERSPLGVVADELSEREPDEGDASRESHGQRRLRERCPRVEQPAEQDVHGPRYRPETLTLRS